jgi:tRNA G18 (ribose-2'-O)-methylase SpoU
MSSEKYQIRVCTNPDCGLRYPLVEYSSFGERCPVCLGQTKLVLELPLFHDHIQVNDPPSTTSNLSVLLDNVRSALNVGSIFRTADGLGFKSIYLCGITPTPESAEVSKSAVGAQEFVKWSGHKNAVTLLEKLKEKGEEIWVLETSQNSITITSAVSSRDKLRPLVLILGNEVTGVDPGILEIADKQVYLPMVGQKRSFNVAVAFAIAAQTLNFWG